MFHMFLVAKVTLAEYNVPRIVVEAASALQVTGDAWKVFRSYFSAFQLQLFQHKGDRWACGLYETCLQ